MKPQKKKKKNERKRWTGKKRRCAHIFDDMKKEAFVY